MKPGELAMRTMSGHFKRTHGDTRPTSAPAIYEGKAHIMDKPSYREAMAKKRLLSMLPEDRRDDALEYFADDWQAIYEMSDDDLEDFAGVYIARSPCREVDL